MHNSRLFALVGAGIAVMGLFLKTLTTAGEGLLPTLSQTGVGLPDGIPTIWGGLSSWAQILLVALIATVVVLALRPVHGDPLDRTSGSIVAVIGLAMVGYAVTEWIDAGDRADALEAAFLDAFRQGIISDAYRVTASTGFMILLVGAVLVVFGGVVALRSEQKSFIGRSASHHPL